MSQVVMVLVQAINLFSLVVVFDVLLSYFMSPYEPLKRTLDRIVEPLLNPIRRVVPPMGMVDFSPLVLILLLQLLSRVIASFA